MQPKLTTFLAILEMEEFTYDELVTRTGASEAAVRSVVRRLNEACPEWSETTTVETLRRGKPPLRYRVTPGGRTYLEGHVEGWVTAARGTGLFGERKAAEGGQPRELAVSPVGDAPAAGGGEGEGVVPPSGLVLARQALDELRSESLSDVEREELRDDARRNIEWARVEIVEIPEQWRSGFMEEMKSLEEELHPDAKAPAVLAEALADSRFWFENQQRAKLDAEAPKVHFDVRRSVHLPAVDLFEHFRNFESGKGKPNRNWFDENGTSTGARSSPIEEFLFDRVGGGRPPPSGFVSVPLAGGRASYRSHNLCIRIVAAGGRRGSQDLVSKVSTVASSMLQLVGHAVGHGAPTRIEVNRETDTDAPQVSAIREDAEGQVDVKIICFDGQFSLDHTTLAALSRTLYSPIPGLRPLIDGLSVFVHATDDPAVRRLAMQLDAAYFSHANRDPEWLKAVFELATKWVKSETQTSVEHRDSHFAAASGHPTSFLGYPYRVHTSDYQLAEWTHLGVAKKSEPEGGT